MYLQDVLDSVSGSEVSRTAQAAAEELRTMVVITTGEVSGIYRPVLKLATKQTGGQTAVARKGKERASRQ